MIAGAYQTSWDNMIITTQVTANSQVSGETTIRFFSSSKKFIPQSPCVLALATRPDSACQMVFCTDSGKCWGDKNRRKECDPLDQILALLARRHENRLSVLQLMHADDVVGLEEFCLKLAVSDRHQEKGYAGTHETNLVF